MILSTHIMQEVQAICSRVVIIDKGKIVADDAIERLQQKSGGEIIILVSFKQNTERKKLEAIIHVKKLNPPEIINGKSMDNRDYRKMSSVLQ